MLGSGTCGAVMKRWNCSHYYCVHKLSSERVLQGGAVVKAGVQIGCQQAPGKQQGFRILLAKATCTGMQKDFAAITLEVEVRVEA